MKTSKLLIFYLLLLWQFSAVANNAADIRLYTLNCGSIKIEDPSRFSDSNFYGKKPLNFADPCFLIKHPKGWMLWDLGLGDQYLGTPYKTSNGSTWAVNESLIAQLKKLNVTPNDIIYVGVSHTHFDHIGNAALFPDATWLIQRSEYDSLASQEASTPEIHNLLQVLRPAGKILIKGDYDIFGDGSVIILSMPGHTIGHQALEINLPHSGAVILSGDLYHTQAAYQHQLVPVFNYSRSETLASMQNMRKILDKTHARLIIQHDPQHYAQLPKPPEYLN